MSRRGGITLADLVVLAVIAVVLTGLFIGGCEKSLGPPESERRANCMNNVRQIGLAMSQYATENDYFPKLVDAATGEEIWAVDPDTGRVNTTDPARSAFAILLCKGYLTTTKVFVCPSSGDKVATADEGFPSAFRSANLDAFILAENQCSYGWDPTKSTAAQANTALIADKPSADVSEESAGSAKNNSDNHKKRGQNVWYVDGHVKWMTTSAPQAGKDKDIYLGDTGYENSMTDAKIIR